MEKLEIICSTKESLNIGCQILIFDIKGKKIIDEKTNNGRLNIYLPHLGLYRVIAIPKNNLIYKITCTNILLHKNSCPILHLSFDKIYSQKWISLILIDQNYKGLPIEKGVITLWPKHT